MAEPRSNGLFGVYVHWPFCAAKCPYCDFNSHVHRGAFDEAAYVAAYKEEIGYFARLTNARPHRAVDLLRRRHAVADGPALGGADPRDHRTVLEHRSKSRDHARGQSRASVEAERFRGYRAAGVKTARLARRAVRCARGRSPSSAAGIPSTKRSRAVRHRAIDLFPRPSFDLIYARPGQTLMSDWENEQLKEALWLAPGPHLALPAYHRDGDALLRPVERRQAEDARART